MLFSNAERQLCRDLQDLPKRFDFRYTEDAASTLLRSLFRSLTAQNDDYLRILFRGRLPKESATWSLRDAQGVTEDMEYTEAARGKACGHIFKGGDSCYRCKTCTNDDTCVLCTRCFEASDHTGHIVTQSISLGNSGCCDCGDEEAWRIPVNCAIHTLDESHITAKAMAEKFPEELLHSVRMTIGRAMDYLIDVISCAPENLRYEKSESSIKEDEKQARLDSVWYKDSADPKPEFALMLWNDEKHTVPEVEQQIARACKRKIEYGREKANEINDTGRSVIEYSTDIGRLLKIASIIKQINLTVTIRSSRDAFREQMCGTIIEWLEDVASCSMGDDHNILRNTICEELLQAWRMGSEASNKWIGKNGLDDHQIEEVEMSGLGVGSPERRPRGMVLGDGRVVWLQVESGSPPNEHDNDDEDEDTESHAAEAMSVDDHMDLDITDGAARPHEERVFGDLDDDPEVSEATYAGYPPPPPPPLALRQGTAPTTNSTDVGPIVPVDAVLGEPLGEAFSAARTSIEIPVTPWRPRKKTRLQPPSYWFERAEKSGSRAGLPLHEDIQKRVRLDWLLLYDLRLWKQVRIDLRDLYISTVVTVPQFKRILGLRFAGLYGVLAQLYLVADREPDHSIINLSLQLFTTPSITKEVVDRGNFITTLFSILYTFLTKRTVQHPWEVGVDDALNFEHGAVANRRMYHFFNDLKHVLGIEYVQQQIRTQERYILQFLDLVRLPQGICPNTRAVGEHVEYESDTWIAAQLLTKEINRICRQFAETFDPREGGQEDDLARAIRIVAKATIVNSMGVERIRFDQAEIKEETSFHDLPPFSFEVDDQGLEKQHKVVDFAVERQPISFHHALHYTLSWLIDFGKGLSSEYLKRLLRFTVEDLSRQPPVRQCAVPSYNQEDYLMALYDFPLRVCAWLAQMKAGMWVRNGISLRHQMTTYRGISHRDLAHHRDIVLLQTAMVTCDPSRVLASIVDRFGMIDWMRGQFEVRAGFELGQQFDVAEDFIHLIIVLLCDRTSLRIHEHGGDVREPAIRRDIVHILCFKPLSFSELSNRFTDKAIDLEAFQNVLEEMTTYRPPEGLADTGSFELKRQYIADVDPYTAHYTKNQRDEAESAYRKWMADKTGKALADIVYEPKLQPIESGIFQSLSDFVKTSLFAQIVFYSLACSLDPRITEGLPMTRIESFIQVALHLMLTAVLEEDDSNHLDTITFDESSSFVKNALFKRSPLGHTILEVLLKILENNEMKSCHAKIRLILHRLRQKNQLAYDHAIRITSAEGKRVPTLATDSLGFDTPATPLDDDEEVRQRQIRQMKKQQALDRQARIMAQMQQQQQSFLERQTLDQWDTGDYEDEDVGEKDVSEEQTKVWKYPTGNCILCQEETNESRLYGTFALLTESTFFRNTDIRDPNFLGEVLSVPSSLDRSADEIRPFGLARQNRYQVTKRTADGSKFVSETQGIGKGFPPLCSTRAPVSTGCGHIMHYSCFTTYCNTTKRRQDHQIARKHPENLELKEFVCPLCKALGNAFLPIIWRGKEETYPGVIEHEGEFDDWMSSVAGPSVSRFFKGQDGRSSNLRRLEAFATHTSKTVIPPLANLLANNSPTPLSSPISPFSGRRYMQHFHSFSSSDSNSLRSPTRPGPSEMQPIYELTLVYNNLRDSMKMNSIPSRFREATSASEINEDFKFSDSLAKALGYSIAAAEVAQRGTQAQEGKTLLDKIPSSLLTHLRVLSETVSSYISIGMISSLGRSASGFEFSSMANRQIIALFFGHPQVRGQVADTLGHGGAEAALLSDPFILLTDLSVYLAPALNLDIHHLLRLCYTLEMVKCVLHLTSAPETFEALRSKGEGLAGFNVSNEDLEALHGFTSQIASFTTPHWPMMEHSLDGQGQPMRNSNPNAPDLYRLLYRAMSTYALTFLRKAVILLYVRYGVDYPESGVTNTDESELTRLTRLLHLPSLPELFAASVQRNALNPSEDGALLRTIRGWVQHWQHTQLHSQPFSRSLPAEQGHEILKKSAYASLKLAHPVIFELIGLPKYYDTLTYEVTRHRCPTKGGKMEDPAICLFCGEIFCSQALCCSSKGIGGANQHMQK